MTTKKVSELTTRKILVHGEQDFILEIPSDVRMTFGPWSPPTDKERMNRHGERSLTGTLRLYRGAATTGNIVALYTNVSSFRDLDSIQMSVQHSLPICRLCKENLIVPGEDLCASCAGHGAEPPLKANDGWGR